MNYRSALLIAGLFGLISCESSSTPMTLPTDSGTVTLHRLNRTELNNTWRDLLGVEANMADTFPSDDSALGFDNMADSLSTSPLHVEMLETVVSQMLDDRVLPRPIPLETYTEEAESDSLAMDGERGGVCCGATAWNQWANGQRGYTLTLPNDGIYIFRVSVWGQQAGPDLVEIALGMDDEPAEQYTIEADSGDMPQFVEYSVETTAGEHRFYVQFLNDYFQDGNDRNLVIDWFEVTGPHDAAPQIPDRYEALFSCDHEAQSESFCAEDIARTFGLQAWRRPVTDSEVERLLDLYHLSRDSGGTYWEGIGLMAKALMLSPHFYYRVELDPDLTETTSHPLTSWELATRLSYFLWSSMPDEALFSAAADGSLLDNEVLESQTRRMLADEKANAIVENLAGQWLHTRAVDDAFPDIISYPEWDESLRESMKEEMRRMATSIFLGDRSMLELLTAEETDVNARLAEHYGVQRNTSQEWETVSLADTSRVGWLTTGGLLTLTSYPTRTSPVQRGKWVLSNLLCETPAPPPDNVDTVLNEETAQEGESLVEQLARHREDPVCASCHQSMDPIGLGMENFDGIGMWRDVDEVGDPIEAAGTLTDGYSFSTAKDLAFHIAEDPKFSRCIAMKTLTYSLGRGLQPYDWDALSQIEGDFAASDYRFADLAVSIVLSDVFRTRRNLEVGP